MTTTIKNYTGARRPDFDGEAGKAWEWTNKQPACLGMWLIHRPDAHPYWSNYALAVAHLRPVEGMPPAHKHSPHASHELILFALDPSHAPDPDDEASVKLLKPQNLVRQLDNYSDAAALLLATAMVRAFVSGDLNPDTDHRSCQERWLDDTIKFNLTV